MELECGTDDGGQEFLLPKKLRPYFYNYFPPRATDFDHSINGIASLEGERYSALFLPEQGISSK